MRSPSERGFTLIEVMITVAIVAILASIALPAYTAYIQRSRVPPMLDALSSVATRLEQRFQDTGSYGDDACDIGTLPSGDDYSLACALADGDFTVTATGSGKLSGYKYTINSDGVRATTAHPNGSKSTCWTIRGGTCDT